MRHLILPFLLLPAAVFAQPEPFGCHYFHGQRFQPAPMTDAQRSQIEETIARSEIHDILHYDIHLDVTDYNGQWIKGHTTVSFKALQEEGTSITFDLLALTVDSVTGPGGPMDFDHDGEFLIIPLDPPLAVGEELDITVHYQGSPLRDTQWGGFYFASNYIYNLGIGISTIPPNFGKVWYPCFDSFVERATYTYHVKSAGTYRLHGQGTFLGETQLGGDTVIRAYHIPQPIPTHLSAIAVADYQTHSWTHQGLNGDIPVTLNAKPANMNGMISRFVDLDDAIDACEHWFGPYGFDRVGYVLTTDGALEIPTNVAYPQFMTGQPLSSNRRLLTHELGHHWWGNIVTPYVHNHMWLKEGPAEYSAHLIEEWQAGAEGLRRAVKNNLVFILRQAHVNDGGYQALSPMPDQYIYGTHTYYKGAAVMHNLRGYLGDEVFRQAMSDIQEQYAYTTMDADEFRDRLEAVTGQDLNPFFDAWVFAPGYGVFEVRNKWVVPTGAQYLVGLEIQQKLLAAEEFHQQVPVDLSFISATGQVYDTLVTLGGAMTAVATLLPFEPAVVALNRYARLNQARLDHEITVAPGQVLDPILPYVDFRLYADNLVDSTFTRVEHYWVRPDDDGLGDHVIARSNTHYWTVDGRWPAGTVLRSRLYYYGANANQLDHELIAGNEEGICVLYRSGPGHAWEVYNGQEVVAGSLTNGTGYIQLLDLKKGQYAFGKATEIVSVSGPDGPEYRPMEVFPVPARDRITVRGHLDAPATLVIDVVGLDGRILRRETAPAQGPFSLPLDLQGIPAGAHVLRVNTTDGIIVGAARFEVLR
ncbi:MAG: M1 family metallopeptidase [Flavobacteriales bacterium]|nr:M1 family metallopeptidase [Flavobacteriales bacterium]